jgi:hypothetical protein
MLKKVLIGSSIVLLSIAGYFAFWIYDMFSIMNR